MRMFKIILPRLRLGTTIKNQASAHLNKYFKTSSLHFDSLMNIFCLSLGQFVELKGSVFKKFEKYNLYQMSCSGKCIQLSFKKALI